MNPQIRKLMSLAILFTLALLACLSYTQFIAAPTLQADSRNARTIYQRWGKDRGSILVQGQVIASSNPVEDRFKFQRNYKQGSTYAAITGYYPTILAGLPTGLEAAKSDVLSGDASYQWASRLRSLFAGEQPRGGSVDLTISAAVQNAAQVALSGHTGAVVALRPQTGEILALYSSPSFDPNALASHDSQVASLAYKDLESNPNRPLINRAIKGDLYPPGSVFKIITAAALLSSGQLEPQTVVDAPDALKLPDSNVSLTNYNGSSCGGGKVPFEYAFQMSCNTPFAAQAMTMGSKPLEDQAKAFGFEKELEIPLLVTPSLFPDPQAPAFLANASIGQQNVRVTPLQMAMVAAGVANQGKVMRPYLVKQDLSAELKVLKQYEPELLSEAVSPQVAAQLRDMMIKVVNAGSGMAAALPGVQVAGKTGTAQTGIGRGQDLWFVGFAPADNPQIALAMVIEDPAGVMGNGGSTVAPLTRQIFAAGLGVK